MRGWFRNVLVGTDGQPSISNVLLLFGLGGPLVVWAVLLGLEVCGVIGPDVGAKRMEWVQQYSFTIILPYCLKKLAYHIGIAVA